MDWMIYGANGYTGGLVARLAVERGEHPILAGRRAGPLGELAEELGLEYRVVGLDDGPALRAALDGVGVVAHCAGPFSQTARQMVEACLARGVHYVDVTGEVEVFEWVFGRHEAARDAGVVLLPGAGFDVVPTDCLAVMLASALPTATHLELAFLAGGGLSPGTARTSLEGMASGSRRRVDGALVATQFGEPARTITFPVTGPREVGAIPWGDLASAYRSTGIPNITVYGRVPAQRGPASPLRRAATRLMGVGPVRRAAEQAVAARLTGPDPQTRARTRTEVWGEVRDAAGEVRTASLVGPNGYDLTADSVVRVVRLLGAGAGAGAGSGADAGAGAGAGAVEPGAHTPATAFGADYVRTLDGVTVNDP
jgi:short subunit dehydrogenase-like uncharacterized protein